MSVSKALVTTLCIVMVSMPLVSEAKSKKSASLEEMWKVIQQQQQQIATLQEKLETQASSSPQQKPVAKADTDSKSTRIESKGPEAVASADSKSTTTATVKSSKSDVERKTDILASEVEKLKSKLYIPDKREYKVEANIGAPQVAYRETIRKTIDDAEGKFVKQSGGRGQYGHVYLELSPLVHTEDSDKTKTFEFENAIVGGAIPKEYIAPVEAGVKEALQNGVIAGYPVVDLHCKLYDGSYHEVDSSALAFEIASRAAFREAMQKGGAVLLEPIMKVEVVTPEDYTGSVIGDLTGRRGQIQGQDMRGNAIVINAMVPLANMFGYVNTLRSFSQGRANFTMQFDHYEQVPQAIAAEVQAKYA